MVSAGWRARMSFVRPEVSEALWRWREVLVGAACETAGLWLVWTSYGAPFYGGIVLALLGAAMLAAGIQRARFRTVGEGPGVVDIDERQITYFGPFGGGAVALEDLVELGVDSSRSWLMRDVYGRQLTIPMNAEGADVLFDAFSAIPGLGAGRLVEAIQSTPHHYTLVWRKPQDRLH